MKFLLLESALPCKNPEKVWVKANDRKLMWTGLDFAFSNTHIHVYQRKEHSSFLHVL